SSVTSCIARFSPYQIDMFLTSNVCSGGISASGGGADPRSRRSMTVCSGISMTKSSICKPLRNGPCTPSSHNSNQYINAKNTGDEQESASPSLSMPIIVGRNGIGKNLQRQRRDRLTEVVVPKTITESSEK